MTTFAQVAPECPMCQQQGYLVCQFHKEANYSRLVDDSTPNFDDPSGALSRRPRKAFLCHFGWHQWSWPRGRGQCMKCAKPGRA